MRQETRALCAGQRNIAHRTILNAKRQSGHHSAATESTPWGVAQWKDESNVNKDDVSDHQPEWIPFTYQRNLLDRIRRWSSLRLNQWLQRLVVCACQTWITTGLQACRNKHEQQSALSITRFSDTRYWTIRLPTRKRQEARLPIQIKWPRGIYYQ